MSIIENSFKRIFPKTAIYILPIFFVVLLGNHPALPQQNLRYYLEIDEQTWDAFYVNITINNNRAEKLLCGIQNRYAGLNANQQSGSGISKFEVTDRFSTKVSFNQIESNTWLIDAKDKDIIIISYKVSNQYDRVLGERLSRSFARVDCGSVFLYVREYIDSPIDLSVRVPHRWKLATGLASTEQMFEYHLINYGQLLKHPLYMAPFDEIYFRLKDRVCYILVDGKRTTEVNKLSSVAAKIAFYQTKLFNDVPFDRYLFIFKLFSGHQSFVSQAYENSAIFYFTYESTKNKFDDLAVEIASSFFQVWNGNRFYPISMKWDVTPLRHFTKNLWFHYGISDYYGALSLVRAGYWSESDFINYQIKLINQLLRSKSKFRSSLADLSVSIMKFDEKKSLEFIRLKGQLISLTLDLKIRELTNDKRSLDDVVFFMNRWFGDQGTSYNDNDILRAIDAVTAVDLTTFFDLYINGAAELPLIEILESAGIFLESKIDTVPDLGDFQISNDGNVISQITKFSPLEKAGVKLGDKLVSLCDQTVYYPQQIEDIVDTLKVGQEISLSIQREGISLMLIAKVAGKPCKAISLVKLEPQTEGQQLIRRSWLAKQLP